MPRGYNKEITQEVINKIKELHEKGVWLTKIAKDLQIPYARICKIIKPKEEKVVITSKVLSEIESLINTIPPRQLASKYNRTLGEMREVLKHLGWNITKEWQETNIEEYKDKIQEYLDCNMSFKDIGEKLDLDRNKIYYICKKLGLTKQPKLRNVVIEPTSEQVTKSYQEILRETADSIRDKLRKQFA